MAPPIGTFSWRDRKGARSTNRVYLLPSQTFGEMEDALVGLLPIMATLTGAALDDIGISLQLGDQAYRRVPVDANDVEKKATFQFLGADGADAIVSIPSYNELFTLPTTANINPDAAAVAAFVAALTAGQFVNINGSPLVSLADAWEDYRGRKRGRR